MDHAERMDVSQYFAKKVVEKYGKDITAFAVAGATAENKDKQWSDIDWIIITKRKIREPYKFAYKDTIPEPYYVTEQEALEIAGDLSYPDWKTYMLLFFSAKVIWGDDRIVKEFQKKAMAIQKEEYKKKAVRALVAVIENANHVRGASDRVGDVAGTVVRVSNFVNSVDEAIALINSSFYRSHAKEELRTFSVMPNNYQELKAKLLSTQDPKQARVIAEQLLDGTLDAGKRAGVQAEWYDSLDKIKI